MTVYDVGEWHGRPYIVMEYLGGGSLADRLAQGVPPVAEALVWLEETARALDAGHRHGIVHRDVKPANLLLDAGGRVHVADFGVASAGGLDSLTATGTILGTAGYLSPEQARGERASPASDRYALAVVAWELLAGERPFANDSPTSEATAHLREAPPSLCGRRRDLPCAELDAVFARALAKDPSVRPGSARELVAELRHALASGAQTTQVMPRAEPAAARRSSRRLLVAGLFVAALIAGVALTSTLGGGSDNTQRTSVRTVRVTQRGTTVTTSVTVTATAPTTAAPPAGGSPTALVDQVHRRPERGALPAGGRRGAVGAEPAGRHRPAYEAYALYDLGAALANLGDCKNAAEMLKDSEKIQGHRSELEAAKHLCHGRP